MNKRKDDKSDEIDFYQNKIKKVSENVRRSYCAERRRQRRKTFRNGQWYSICDFF